jgi:hypothetical protein
MRNERNLPALITSPEVIVLEHPIARQKMFKTVWTKVLMVKYRTTAEALLPVMELVDNRDLALVVSSKEGVSEVRLSLIDVWSGKGSFPSVSEIDRILTQIGKEPAGIPEMALFAKAINRQPIALSSGYFLAIAPRDSLRRGNASHSVPSTSQDEHDGVKVGLTYDWVIERHHVYVLVID